MELILKKRRIKTKLILKKVKINPRGRSGQLGVNFDFAKNGAAKRSEASRQKSNFKDFDAKLLLASLRSAISSEIKIDN